MRKKKQVQLDHSEVKLLGLENAAERLGLSAWTLRRWAQQGRIASVKLSNRLLIPESVVEGLIARNYRAPDAPESMRMA